MTLNLPQTLYDLNHHHHPSLRSNSSFPSMSISRFSRNVLHLPWHSTSSRRSLVTQLPRQTHIRPSSRQSLDTLFLHRSTILSRFTAYRRLRFLVLLSRIPREIFPFSSISFVALSHPFLIASLSLPRADASQFQSCQF